MNSIKVSNNINTISLQYESYRESLNLLYFSMFLIGEKTDIVILYKFKKVFENNQSLKITSGL